MAYGKQISYRCQSHAHKMCRGSCYHGGHRRRCRCSCHFHKQLRFSIPEGMIWAVLKSSDIPRDHAERTLRLAFRWLAENPIAPTPGQAKALFQMPLKINYDIPYDATRAVVVEWQRRMFLKETEK